MLIISFDLGEANFACFAISVDDGEASQLRSHADAHAIGDSSATCIEHWSNSEIIERGKSIAEFVQAVGEHIRRGWVSLFSRADHVVIEQQLLRNPRMKCAAHALQGIFAFNGIGTTLMPPRHKFRAFPAKLSGKERSSDLKKISVILAHEWVLSYRGRLAAGVDDAFALMSNEHGPKRDDLADAALQAVSSLYAQRPPRQ